MTIGTVGFCGMALTAKQEAFAQHYAVHRNGPEAYRTAFTCKPDISQGTLATEASKLLGNPEISNRIIEIINAATVTSDAVMTVAKLQEVWKDLAFADPNELIGLRVGACRHCYGENHLYQWKEHEYFAALAKAEKDPAATAPDIAGGFGYWRSKPPNPDCPVCEGEGLERIVPRDTTKLSPSAKLLYGGVKQTRNGVELIIADRTKALENLGRVMGAYTDKVKLDGSLQLAAQAVITETTDPEEASRIYQQMIGKIKA